MLEPNIWDTLNILLAAIGMISIVITIIRIVWIFLGGEEWVDNIKIEELPLTEDLENRIGMYPQYYPVTPWEATGEYCTQNLFIPQNTIIRKAKLKKVKFEEINDALKYKTIHTFEQITPHSPICLVIERTEAIPTYMIEWKIEYGGKATYYFCDNLRNGDNSLNGIQYHYGIWAKVRKVLDLK